MNDDTGYPRKRAQTRRRLLRAGMEVLAERGPAGATVGEIATRAGMSPGTFYNHFTSMPELVQAITDWLGRGVEIGTETLDAVEHDPAARVALGALQLLQMAEDDPTAAAAFVALTASDPEFRARVRAIVARAIADGVDSGRFDVAAGQAATNALVGTTLQAIRSRLLGETEAADSPVVARLALRILGVPAEDIDEVVERARRSLHDRIDAAAHS